MKKLKPESYLLIEDPDSELAGKEQHHLVGVALDREDQHLRPKLDDHWVSL